MILDDESALIAREQANGHSIYGASKSPRYLACTGSLRAEFGLPDTARYEAAEGTVAHSIADEWMRTGVEPRHRLGEIVEMKLHTGTYHIPVEEVMFTHLREHVERCMAAKGDHYFEQFVDYSRLTPIPRQGGSADHFVCNFGHLELDDLKYGVADQIFARSPQLSLYALGVIYKWDWLYSFERVTLRINQPRLDHFDVWETTVDELLVFAEEAKVKMHEAWRLDAPRTPSEYACRYCKAKLNCGPAASLIDRAIDVVFGDEREPSLIPAVWTEPPPAKIAFNPDWKGQTTPALVNLLRYRKLLEKIFDEAHDELSSRIIAGERAEGWGIYEGKNSRHVSDRNGILRLLCSLRISPAAAFDSSFKSPAQLEELLVKARISKGRAERLLKPFVRVTPGAPVVSQAKPGKRVALNLADDSFVDETEIMSDL